MVEISRSPTLRPLQTPIFNLSPISTGLSIQEEEEPRWASLRASTEIPPGPTAMQTYFFFLILPLVTGKVCYFESN